MAIQMSEGFQYFSDQPLDSRMIFSSVEEMKNTADYKLYDGCISVISGDPDHKQYVWWNNNERTAELGKWKEMVTGGVGSAITTKEIISRVNLGGIEYGNVLPEGTSMTDFIDLILSPDAVFPMIDLDISMSEGAYERKPGVYVKGTTLVGGKFNIVPHIDESVNRVMHHIDYYYQRKTDIEPIMAGQHLASSDTSSVTVWSFYYPSLTLSTDFKLIAKIYYTGSELEEYTEKVYEADFTFIDAAYYGLVNNPADITAKNIKQLDKIGLKDSNFYWTEINITNACPVYAFPMTRGKITSIKDINGYELINDFLFTTLNIDNINYYVYYGKKPTTVERYALNFYKEV